MKLHRQPLESDIAKLVAILKTLRPEKIMIFGSAARGEVGEWSDLDVIVIKKTTEPFIRRLRNAPSLLSLSRSCDLLIYTPQEFSKLVKTQSPFVKNILKENRVLYET